MNNKNFVKLTADNDGEVVDITLNTSNIDSYIAIIGYDEDGKDLDGTKCRISISSSKDMGCDIMYVYESKEYLDNLLT